MLMGKHMVNIHGHKVFCEDDRAKHGLDHLAYHLKEDESHALFQQAEASREVDFQDVHGRKFTLVDGENGTFSVVTHDRPSGWV